MNAVRPHSIQHIVIAMCDLQSDKVHLHHQVLTSEVQQVQPDGEYVKLCIASLTFQVLAKCADVEMGTLSMQAAAA